MPALNQLGRRNLSDFQFKLLVGQEYELEKKLEGGDGSNQYTKQPDQSDHVPGGTRERLAKEHGISPKTVQRSSDLYKAHKAIGEVAPEVRVFHLATVRRIDLSSQRNNIKMLL